MSGVPYKVTLVPQGTIPKDTGIGIHLRKEGPPAGEEFTVGTGDCGNCGGIDAPDGLTIANTGVTTLTFFPIALNLGPWPPIADYEQLPGHNDADEIIDFVHWYVSQQGGSPRTPSVSLIGATINDGLKIVFNDSTDGGPYTADICFTVTISHPDPWFGPGNRNFGCDVLFPCGVDIPIDVDIVLSSGLTFTGASYSPYVGHYGFEEALPPWFVTFEATGFPSGFVNWEFDDPVDPVWQYNIIVQDATTLTLSFTFAGGSNPDVAKFRAVDSGDSGIIAPPVPPDDDGWVLITQ